MVCERMCVLMYASKYVYALFCLTPLFYNYACNIIVSLYNHNTAFYVHTIVV